MLRFYAIDKDFSPRGFFFRSIKSKNESVLYFRQIKQFMLLSFKSFDYFFVFLFSFDILFMQSPSQSKIFNLQLHVNTSPKHCCVKNTFFTINPLARTLQRARLTVLQFYFYVTRLLLSSFVRLRLHTNNLSFYSEAVKTRQKSLLLQLDEL